MGSRVRSVSRDTLRERGAGDDYRSLGDPMRGASSDGGSVDNGSGADNAGVSSCNHRTSNDASGARDNASLSTNERSSVNDSGAATKSSGSTTDDARGSGDPGGGSVQDGRATDDGRGADDVGGAIGDLGAAAIISSSVVVTGTGAVIGLVLARRTIGVVQPSATACNQTFNVARVLLKANGQIKMTLVSYTPIFLYFFFLLLHEN